MRVTLDRVPLRDAALGPAEILMSESQERMMAIVPPGSVPRFMEICARWEVPATVIGEVTGTGRLEMTWRGEQVVDIPPGSAADDGPVYHRPLERPAWQDALTADDPAALPRPADGAGLRADVLALLGSAEAADKAWVTEQYDSYVRGDTVLSAPQDAGLVRVDAGTDLGLALATDGNGRYTLLDPYAGAQLALAEAYRNVAATGARPLAVTNCLNFGSPEDPAVMWQFAEAVRGLADALRGPGRAGDRRQRELLQPDRRRPRSTRRRWSGSSACTTTSGSGCRSGSRSAAPACCCSAKPGRSSAARCGRWPGTGTPAAGRPRWTWTPSGGWPRCSPPRPRPGCWRPRTTCPTAAWRSRWPSAAWPGRSAPWWPCPRPQLRLPACSASPRRGRWSRSGRARRTACAACARSTRCPPRTWAGPAGTRLTVSGLFRIPLAELAAAHRGPLPSLFS